MSTRGDEIEKAKAKREDATRRLREHKLSHLPKTVDGFNSPDPRARMRAICHWADDATENPGEWVVLKYLPDVVRHFSDPNIQVMGAAIDAWRAAFEANPRDDDVIKYLPKVVECFGDPSVDVRDAAYRAWEIAAKANGDHPLVDRTREAYESARR